MKLIGLTIASILLMIAFIVISIAKFGLLSCYSAYAERWGKALNIHNVNLWSAVTVVSALLLVPPLVEAGSENPLQCLGFITPIYLLIVAFTPRYESVRKDKVIHTLAAAICAILATCWIVFVKQVVLIIPAVLTVAVVLMVVTKTFRSWLFWTELSLFTATWAALLT